MSNVVNVDFITKVVEIEVNDNETESLAAMAAVNAAKRADEKVAVAIDEIDDFTDTKKSELQVYVDNAAASATNASNSAYSAQATATALTDIYNEAISSGQIVAPAVDPTLTISGAAADAKVTGNIGRYGLSRSFLDFEWESGYVDYSGNIVESESYKHSRLIQSSEFYNMKITTVNAVETWAYKSDGSFVNRRSDIPANSTEYTPTSDWLSSGTQCRLVVPVAGVGSVSAYVESQTLALQAEYANTKKSVEHENEYLVSNDTRFSYGKNLFDVSTCAVGYTLYVSTGETGVSANTFVSAYIPIKTVGNYAFLIGSSSIGWNKPASRRYAFYDNNFIFTHGGVAALDEDVTSVKGDAYCRISYYTGAQGATMFGLLSELSEYIGVVTNALRYVAYPTYPTPSATLINISNPYYFPRIMGNRISVSKNGTKEGAFIKFDSISVYSINGWRTKTWSEFKSDVSSDLYVSNTTSYDKTPDVISMLANMGVVYNYATNTYHILRKVDFEYLSKNEIVIFYNDENSEPYGLLYEAYMSKKETGIAKYIRTVEELEADLLSSGGNFTFAFATDCHWYFDDTAYHNYTNELITQIKNAVGYDCYINGGDSIYYGTKWKLNGIAGMSNVFVPDKDIVYCLGNHDYNGVATGDTQDFDWMFSDTQLENLYVKRIENINRTAGKKYYYRDFTDKKVRVIVLDTSDVPYTTFDADGKLTSADPLITYVVRQEQINWLCNALQCPDDNWHIVVVMHVGLYLPEDGFVDNNPLNNRQALINVLNAFVNKTSYSYSTTGGYPVSGSGTFANAHGSLIGVWSGHAHVDGYCNTDGFNAIQTACGYPEQAERIPGTIDELCVDYVNVDTTNRTITLKRFGWGSDRSYTF